MQGPMPPFMPPTPRYRPPNAHRGETWRLTIARTNAIITILLDWLSLAEGIYGLAGPIFEKELRVSGRMRRSYILRFVYMAVMGAFVGMEWLTAITLPGIFSGARGVQGFGMAHVGLVLTETIIWFQFVVLQPVAIIMLSTSISDEVYHRTLGVLMTTPINNVQIVIGKFLGRLYQMILLMALAVPVLIVVRVMGGVEAEFLLAGTAITLVTIAFISAATMFFSVSSRNAPLVIAKATLALLAVYLVVPLAWEYGGFVDSSISHWLPYISPHVALAKLTDALGKPTSTVIFDWWVNVAFGLGATVLVLLGTMVRVRRAALRQIMGVGGGSRLGAGAAAKIRRIKGSPVVWREARGRIFKNRVRGLVGTAALLGVLAMTYVIFWGWIDDHSVHLAYGEVLLVFGTLATAVITAGAITAEKESGVWSILMVTPLDSKDIVLGKIIGVLRRSLPAWAPLGFHLVFFIALGRIHFIVLPLVAMLVFGIAVLMASSGVLFGVLLKRTMTATVANLLVCVLLWIVVPMILLIGFGIFVGLSKDASPLAAVFTLHPNAQIGLILNGGSGLERTGADLGALRFSTMLSSDWHSETDVFGMTGIVLLGLVFNVGLAILFGRAAADRMRRNMV
jgi:ABC-type transport system involved in multi-copper enzyme maturation permease subunit